MHLPDLRRAGLRGPAGLRLRRHAAGAVHARRRRHLHEGGRRRRRPGRQDREGHPRGRPAQRRDHRRQRGRQRRRLRRHGGRHLRELRSDDRRRDDPRHGQLRPQGRDLPAARPRHRRARLDHQHLHASRPARTTPRTRPCKSVHRGFWIGSLISVVGFFAARRSATCASTPPTSPTTRWPRRASRAATRRRCPSGRTSASRASTCGRRSPASSASSWPSR